MLSITPTAITGLGEAAYAGGLLSLFLRMAARNDNVSGSDLSGPGKC